MLPARSPLSPRLHWRNRRRVRRRASGRTVAYNLRQPGQIFDGQAGLHQNGFRDYDPAIGRYAQSDPIGLTGGVNTYSYSRGNVLASADPLGLWSTAAHNAIIQTAFPDLWFLDIEAIEDGSASVDAPLNQGAATAYQHAMTAPGQSAADAKSRMCKFVRDNLQEYRRLISNPDGMNEILAYRALGRALHPIMDSTSPAHSGWQPWGNPWEPAWWGEWDSHGDSAGTVEGLKDLKPDLLQKTLNRIRQVMNDAGSCGCIN